VEDPSEEGAHVTSTAERARYWGALNRLRQIAERDYGGGGRAIASERQTRVIGWVVGGIGVAFILPEIALVRSVRDLSEYAVLGVLAAVGLLLTVVAVNIVRASIRASRSRRAYDDRGARREACRRGLQALAARCEGRVDDGVGAGRRFLADHWPDRAPAALLVVPAEIAQDAGEARVTLTGKLDGCPLLVSFVDFASESGRYGVRPPVLVVLVASPLDAPTDPPGALPLALPCETTRVPQEPFRTSARQLEEMDSYRDLVRDGFSIHWTRAGIAAVRDGAERESLDVENIERIAQSARELCRISPKSRDAPQTPAPLPDFDESSCRAVLEAFLGALNEGDTVGVLARAHPRLFLGWPMEPSPAALLAVVDAAGVRPFSWEHDVYVHASSGGTRTLDQLGQVDRSDVDCINLAMTITHAGRKLGANVCMLRLDGRSWQVTGYTVGSKQLLGVEFPQAGD
jgi:hypothetical protein